MIGVAQERARVWAGWRQGGSDGHPHFAVGWQSRVPNHYYFYVRDREWGRAFVKCCCYAPYPLWLCLNGHEWAKRQAEQAGIGYQPLDNGFRSCSDGEALAAIYARLRARDVWSFFRRWQRVLPSPLTAEDGRRGYRYQLAFRQLELSDTRVFDRPQAGRDSGRPSVSWSRIVCSNQGVEEPLVDVVADLDEEGRPAPALRFGDPRVQRRAARSGPRRRSTTASPRPGARRRRVMRKAL